MTLLSRALLGAGVSLGTLASTHAWGQASELAKATDSLLSSGNIAIAALTFTTLFFAWRAAAGEKRVDAATDALAEQIEKYAAAQEKVSVALTSLQGTINSERESNALEFATIRQTLMRAIPSAPLADADTRPRRKPSS
jgi:hypothetical protein